MKDTRVQQLLRDLDEAFRGVPRPKITKSVARGIDDDWVLSETRVQELGALDLEVDWHDVSEDDTATFQEYFSFADAAGWRFYLPAFIRHYLINLDSPKGDAVYWACTSSTPKFELLTPLQMKCVKEFLEIVHED